MKRQAFIKALGILPVALLQACKKSFPDTPTIVTGKVIDENNMPVEGVVLEFAGTKPKGLSAISTFRIQVATNKEGIYSLSQVIPNDTSFSEFSPFSYKNSFFFSIQEKYMVLFFKNGTYKEMTDRLPIQREEYGGTVTFNFQIRKR